MIEFLKARLDEDDQAAVAAMQIAGDPRWTVEDTELKSDLDGLWRKGWAVLSMKRGAPGIAVAERNARAAVDHIANWDPRRVREEIAAKRSILAEHVHYRNPDDPDEIACDICHLGRPDQGYRANGWCVTVVALASVYRRHPDWRKEWAA
jgi:hypothetical protein